MKILLIGFGHAGKAYLSGILDIYPSAIVHIVDPKLNVIDMKEDNVFYHNDVPFSEEFLLSIVATPPDLHLSCIESVINISNYLLVEKPLAISLNDIESILNIASQSNKIFFSIHSRFGLELDMFNKSYSDKKIVTISQFFSDPYGEDKLHLGGAFHDSIFNMLGVLNEIIPSFHILRVTSLSNDKFCYKASSVCRSLDFEFTYNQFVSWDAGFNFKGTQVLFDSGECIFINHSQQSISNNDGLLFEHRVFSSGRLSEHYKGVLQDFFNFVENKDSKINNTISIINAYLFFRKFI